MTVPYGDPRAPFQRKQAFDFGDAGAGRAANNLALGCDCLGVIKYFDAVMTEPDGTSSISKNVVCLHEQDNGIGWKHTNFRTDRAVVTRLRELVVQFIITLANYEVSSKLFASCIRVLLSSKVGIMINETNSFYSSDMTDLEFSHSTYSHTSSIKQEALLWKHEPRVSSA